MYEKAYENLLMFFISNVLWEKISQGILKYKTNVLHELIDESFSADRFAPMSICLTNGYVNCFKRTFGIRKLICVGDKN